MSGPKFSGAPVIPWTRITGIVPSLGAAESDVIGGVELVVGVVALVLGAIEEPPPPPPDEWLQPARNDEARKRNATSVARDRALDDMDSTCSRNPFGWRA
jgi:hypothetical protein